MTRMEETEALRARTDVHYNCCQSVLVPFADLCGLDRRQPSLGGQLRLRHAPWLHLRRGDRRTDGVGGWRAGGPMRPPR